MTTTWCLPDLMHLYPSDFPGELEVFTHAVAGFIRLAQLVRASPRHGEGSNPSRGTKKQWIRMFVYMTVNIINYRWYIGQTKYPKETGYIGSGLRFRRAVKKYGKHFFIRHDVFEGTEEDVDRVEAQLITYYKATENSGDFYNLREGGNCSRHGAKTRKLISEIRRANPIHYTLEMRKERSERVKGIKNPNSGPMSALKKAKTRWGSLKRLFSKEPIISEDIRMMHDFYDFRTKMAVLSPELLKEYLKFRFRFLQEEIDEGNLAIEHNNAEEVVDSLIDLIVVAIGTLDLYEVSFKDAWYKVLGANMSKTPGVKASRPNPWGLPDLIKPSDWVAPSHDGNHGRLSDAFENSMPCEV